MWEGELCASPTLVTPLGRFGFRAEVHGFTRRTRRKSLHP